MQARALPCRFARYEDRYRTLTSTPGYLRLGAEATFLAGADNARVEFADAGSIVCQDAMAPDILDGIVRVLGRARFVSDTVRRLGHREIEAPAIGGTAISLMLNRAPLFRWLEAVTACEPIRTISGRVVQTHARTGDELVWHDDMGGDPRRLGITVALDSPPYAGGEFELRRVGEQDLLRRFKHDRIGTALIFAVSHALEHRVLPLSAGGPRRVFTGWFVG